MCKFTFMLNEAITLGRLMTRDRRSPYTVDGDGEVIAFIVSVYSKAIALYS